MVRLLDTEIRSERLVFRVLIALLLASLSLVVLYLFPKMIIGYVNLVQDVQLQTLLIQLLDIKVLTFGILASIFVLITVTLRTTKAEGPLLILMGVSFIVYWFTLFHGGTLEISIPEAVIRELIAQYPPMPVQGKIVVNLSALLYLAVCPAFLIIVKGALLTLKRFRNPRAQ